MRKKGVSIKKKLIILCLSILIIPTLAISVSGHNITKGELTQTGETQLKKSTKLVIGMIELLNKEVEAGNITKEEAQEQLRQELFGEKDAEGKRHIKEEYAFGKTGYVWAVDDQSTVVMHPLNEGESIANTVSEDGVRVGPDSIELGKTGGVFYYEWKDLNTQKVAVKMAYVERDPNWGWTIASSAYEEEFNAGAAKISVTITVITVVAIIFGTILSYLMAVRITNPIMLIKEELNHAAQGDFSGGNVTVTSRDEIGDLVKDYNTMKGNMKELLTHVNRSTQHVASSAEQLSASAEQTNRATEEITNSIQELASAAETNSVGLMESSQSLEEVSVAIQNLAEASTEMSVVGATITEHAQQGNVYVEQTVQQMNSIHQKVNESGEVLELLDSSSNEIGEITKVITAIANQTNLLALNAAIEAARAGEHGKGFAIVADEVRKLAEQSQSSAHQISDLIQDIQKNMSRSTQSIHQVTVEVKEGLEIVEKTESSFQEIVLMLEGMKEKVTEMAATVEQMSASTQEISATVMNNSNVTKEMAGYTKMVAGTTEEQLAAMQEITASSNSLSNLAMELQELIGKFKL